MIQMEQSNGHWNNQMDFLEKATLSSIKSKYDEINKRDFTFATATQVFPVGEDKEGHQLYDALFYYKNKFSNIVIPKEGEPEKVVLEDGTDVTVKPIGDKNVSRNSK